MDAFDSSLGSFETAADQNSFMDFFQQQQQTSGGQMSHPIGASANGMAGMNNGANNGGLGNTDLSSPGNMLHTSTSPASYDPMPGDNTASSDSPSPHYAQNMSSGSSVGTSVSSGKPFASSHMIHPMTTPIRHNSLPFDNSNQSQQQQQPNRFGPGGASRQLSVGSPSSNPASPSLMKPPPGLPGSIPNSSSTDFLNPNAPMNNSPSPLRTSVPLATQSPEDSNASQSSINAKREDGRSGSTDRSPVVPSQSPSAAGNSYGVYGGKDAGAGSLAGDANSGAASAKFVHKLFRMVSDAEYQHLISWNASGTSVVVTNFDEFAKEVLGKHFKHSNFSSFIRQLNMYGFYKVNKTPRGHRHAVDTQVWEFSHPKFVRGHPELLDDIRRKALDSEHARVEARDLQYSVSVGHLQLRQQVDEQQYRIEELFEMNIALRQMVAGLRDTLSNVLEWVKANNGGQLPFDNRLAGLDLPPTPMMQPYMNSWGPGGPGAGMPGPDIMGDGPPIFVTEPAYHGGQLQQHPQMQQQQPPSPHDVFSMSSMGQVSPLGSRRVSASSQQSERMEGSSKQLTLDTQHLQQYNNPGLGVMGLAATSPMSNQMMTAMNTPLPPSPAVHGGPQMGYVDSPFLGSPSMASFPAGSGYFTGSPMVGDEEDSLLGPNAKSMRTPLKRTASNSGQHQMAVQAALGSAQQKRKSPGV